MTNSYPLVTVLMPVYNGARFLREAVESILKQTFADFEFLIINDGSTDNSVGIIKSYNDSRIRLIHNGERRGVTFSLNKGVKFAEGTYLARMDTDDISLPTRLEKQVKFLRIHPEVGVCGTWVDFFTRIPGIGGKYCPTGGSNIVKAMLIFENVIQHPTVMAKTALFRHNPYPSRFPHAEDYGLWMEIIKKIEFAVFPEILLHYRLHASQIGQTRSREQVFSVAKVHREMLASVEATCSSRELAIHESICSGKYEFTQEYIDEVENWLRKILAVNNKKKIFDQKSLEKVVSSRWLSVCLMHSMLRHWIWQRYWQSPLSRIFKEPGKIRQFWLESILFPSIRPYAVGLKKNRLVKKILLG